MPTAHPSDHSDNVRRPARSAATLLRTAWSSRPRHPFAAPTEGGKPTAAKPCSVRLTTYGTDLDAAGCRAIEDDGDASRVGSDREPSRARQVPMRPFQSALPRGERPGCSTSLHLRRDQTFQSALPRGERPSPLSNWISSRALAFQSALPRGERPAQHEPHRARRRSPVSIRAPAWGATQYAERDALERYVRVSIRAPAWGATLADGNRVLKLSRFNPRSRVGSDTCAAGSNRRSTPVSIRAPAWGATLCRACALDRLEFQSALPRGERPASSRSDYILHRRVSIRAPAWGATSVIVSSVPGRRCFNPRSRVGSDHELRLARRLYGFNPRSRVGSDRKAHETRRRNRVSIRAPAWGATADSLDDVQERENRLFARTVDVAAVRRRSAYPMGGGTPVIASHQAVREPRGLRMLACRSRTDAVTIQAAHPGHEPVWRRRARPAVASSHPGSRSAGCPRSRRSR